MRHGDRKRKAIKAAAGDLVALGGPSRTKQLRKEVKSEVPTAAKAEHDIGAIVKLELKNFMNHGELEFEPGSKVNMITGVNGAGKSSIFQAIVIGLGECLATITVKSPYFGVGQAFLCTFSKA